jgi:hypothetical protein
METPTPRVKRLLTPIHNEDGTILVQETPKSVLYDHWPDGFDYACPHCRDHILVVNVRNDQIWDVTFKCFACGKMSTAPTLPPGMAFPARHIEFLQGWYSLRESADLKRATVAGHAAGERRKREAGEKGVTFGDTKTLENREADAEFLVLGDQVYVQQVLLNLLMNGIEALHPVTDRPRELRIRSQRHDADTVLVAVQAPALDSTRTSSTGSSTRLSPPSPKAWA